MAWLRGSAAKRLGCSLPPCRGCTRSPGNSVQPPAFFSKLTESNSAMVKSKKQEIIKKLSTSNRNEAEYSENFTRLFLLPQRPSSTFLSVRPAGSTPFPYNPLTVRLSTGVVTGPPPPTATVLQGNSGTQNHGWEEEPKPLLVSQYETLSDSE
ncbi:hypothetical protein E2320_012728 [Naja naja]|nr:hypothetical protein E2320_012728 [Naja naja]